MDVTNPRVAVIGEVMAEFSPSSSEEAGQGFYRLGFAGDTFNTAVTLARLGVPTCYATLLGDDPFSDRIIDLMEDEGIVIDLVERLPDRQPGLYVIANTPSGERSFRYWRGESPARQLWTDRDSTQRFEATLRKYACIYLSGITLAIIQPAARIRLRTFLLAYRQSGGLVAFDSNFRPRLWQDIDEARSVIAGFLDVTDIALVTLEDEQALWNKGSAAEISEFHSEKLIAETVIKQGGEPVSIYDGKQLCSVEVPIVENIVDTTGAGDAFNAGYLALRLQGGDPIDAVRQGNRTASIIIGERGGIVPRHLFLSKMKGA